MLSRLAKVLSLLQPDSQYQLRKLALLTALNAACEVTGVALSLPLLKLLLSGNLENSDSVVWLTMLFPGALTTHLIAWLCILVALFLLLSNVLSALVLGETARFGGTSWQHLSVQAFKFYINLPYEKFLHRSFADLYKLSVQDTENVSQRVLIPLLQMVARGINIGALLLTLLYLFPLTTGILIITLSIVYSGIYHLIKPHVHHNARMLWQARRDAGRVISNAYQGVKEVRVFRIEETFVTALRDSTEELPNRLRNQLVISTLPKYLIEGAVILIALLGCAVAVLLGYPVHVLGPIAGVSALAAFRLLPLCTQSYQLMVTLRFGLIETETLLQDLQRDHKTQVADARSAADNPAAIHSDDHVCQAPVKQAECPLLVLRNVTYRHPGANENTLDKLNLEVKQGEFIGIFGPSGSGKSTLLDVVLGLLQPSAGRVYIDGYYFNRDWRGAIGGRIGYVPQHTFLLDDSIAGNIAFGVPRQEIDYKAVRRVAQLAGVDQFVSEFEDGYEQHIGDRGVRLSGGQCQRIAIARALYLNPAILVFDEATSALDEATELEVLSAISRLKGSTIILVTHRVKTLSDCDRVFRLTNKQLLAVNQQDNGWVPVAEDSDRRTGEDPKPADGGEAA